METVSDAIAKLNSISGFAEVMTLYRKNFPSKFRRTVKARSLTPLADSLQVAMAIDDFTESLERKFPVYWGNGDFIAESLMEGSFPYLPVATCPLVDSGTQASDLRLGYRVIFAATDNMLRDSMLTPLVGPRIGKWPGPDRVAAICNKKRGPIRYLADAYRYAVQDTGNNFLDISEEDGLVEPVDYTQEMIDFFTQEWREARVILHRCKLFNCWIEADIRRVKPVVEILRQAASDEGRVRVTTDGRQYIGAPLVETLGGLIDEDDDYEDEEIY